jgi:mannose-1-phosphate guanylyltransferase / phosphomannomutase
LPNLRAAIIAGGQGTRIRSITNDTIPKALVPVAGEPIVFRQLELLARYGVTEVAVMAGHLAGPLKEQMPPRADQLGIRLEFFVEDGPLGTAGGFHAAKDFLSGGDFLVIYGDVAVEMDFMRLAEFHDKNNAVATVVCHPNDHPHESDLLRVDSDDRVLEILPRKQREAGFYRNLVPAAVYCCSDNVFDFITPSVKQDFIKDIFPRMIKEGASLYAYNTPEYLKDMGTIARYDMVEKDIQSGLFSQMNSSRKRAAVFFDRDGVLNREIPGRGIVNQDQFELLPGAAEAVKQVNQASLLAVVVTNQPQLAKGFLSRRELDGIFAKFETLLGYEGAKIDRYYLCPHHPERGFDGEVAELKIDCECRKPKAGMLLKAVEQLPINLEKSCMIGDTWRDIGAARNAGIFAYGVRTGFGCRDCSGDSRPDLIFSDVREAVDFVINGVPEAKSSAEKITEMVEKSSKTVLVGVSGLTRSGKSTFAHAVLKELREKGTTALHLRLDDWILPVSKRGPGSKAEERLQVDKYRELINKLLAGEEIIAPGYDAATRESAEEVAYTMGGEKAVLLDGMFGCHENIREMLDYAVYIDIDEELLRSRFADFYSWKGDETDQIDRLLAERMKEEWPAVNKQLKTADQIINFGKV